MSLHIHHIRSALFMPASNARAIEKGRTLPADMLILDLEDAVADDQKAAARDAAIAQVNAGGFSGKLVAIRANADDTHYHADDLAALALCKADIIVLPKVEDTRTLDHAARITGKPLIAMIETPKALYAAREIAAHPAVIGLFAGTNDLAAEMNINLQEGRDGLSLALQMMALAAANARIAVFDGVNNQLDDLSAMEAECAAAKRMGFHGKTLIHPKQIEAANRIFAPSAAQLEDARALIEAAQGGAERFRGRMVEAMHVRSAQALLSRLEQQS